jgi:SlyX protein
MNSTKLLKEKCMSKIEERLTELEIRFTHQARLIEELNEVVTDCNQSIARLEAENGRLREMVKSFAPELAESPDE